MTLFLLPAVFHLKLQKLYIFAKFGEKVGEAKAAHETSFGKEEISLFLSDPGVPGVRSMDPVVSH